MRAPKVGEKEGERHEGADISYEIEQGVIGIDVAVDKALDIDLPDAFKGSQIDVAFQIRGAPRGIVYGSRNRPSAERLIKERQIDQKIDVQEKKEDHGAVEDAVVVRSSFSKDRTEVEQRADHAEQEHAKDRGLVDPMLQNQISYFGHGEQTEKQEGSR